MRVAVSREPAGEREVAPLELFFDLVYVFAMGSSRTSGTVALWWCYFERAEPIGISAAAANAGAVGWWANWALTMIVLALIAVAVGDELAIAHPSDDVALGFTVLTFGGPALFLVGQAVFHGGVIRRVPRTRLWGIAALAVLAVATAPFTLIAGIAASSAVLVAIAIADTTQAGPGPRV